jgi:hypothetical protein
MERREFIALGGAAAATWPLAVHAQHADKLATIGYLGDDASRIRPTLSDRRQGSTRRTVSVSSGRQNHPPIETSCPYRQSANNEKASGTAPHATRRFSLSDNPLCPRSQPFAYFGSIVVGGGKPFVDDDGRAPNRLCRGVAIVFFASRPISINRPRSQWSEKWEKPISWRD